LNSLKVSAISRPTAGASRSSRYSRISSMSSGSEAGHFRSARLLAGITS
jgi:hypothetical protein